MDGECLKAPQTTSKDSVQKIYRLSNLPFKPLVSYRGFIYHRTQPINLRMPSEYLSHHYSVSRWLTCLAVLRTSPPSSTYSIHISQCETVFTERNTGASTTPCGTQPGPASTCVCVCADLHATVSAPPLYGKVCRAQKGNGIVCLE